MMKILINFIVLCSLIIGQAEYQILTLPKNLFQLSTNGGLSSIPNQNNYFNPATYKNKKNNYGFSLIQYPSDIMMLNLNTNKFSLSILDYGNFIDQEYDTVHKKFTSNEVLLQYFYKHTIKKVNIGISIGGFYSKIYTYNSYGLTSSIGINSYYKKINTYLGLSIENFGNVLKPYISYRTPMPVKYRLSINHNINTLLLGYDILYSKNSDQLQYILCLRFKISKKINLIISNSSYSADLNIEEDELSIFSGFSSGLNINLNSISLDLGFKNIGIAGFVYGMSLNFKLNNF